MNGFQTPVLFLIFNRPELTARTFLRIREMKPKHLFVAADGARENVADEYNECLKVRSIVINGIDWDCEYKTLFNDKNLGCKKAVSQAIDWFFENVEEGIILEDDCLPHNTFFDYAEDLLQKYRNDPRVMQVGGCNYDFETKIDSSYFFSKYINIWGWATWKRAWKFYREAEKLSKEEVIAIVNSRFSNPKEIERRISNFNSALFGTLDTWDYTWSLACLSQNGLSVIPRNNSISNIGWGNGASRTTSSHSILSNLKLQKIDSPLKHPSYLIFSRDYDLFISNNYGHPDNEDSPSLFRRVIKIISKSIT